MMAKCRRGRHRRDFNFFLITLRCFRQPSAREGVPRHDCCPSAQLQQSLNLVLVPALV